MEITGEITIPWLAFREGEKSTLASCFAVKHGLTKSQASALVRVFNITNPDIVLGTAGPGQSYARLADTTQDRKEILTLLLKTYIV